MTEESIRLKGSGIKFSYGKNEIVHGMDMEIGTGTVTALLGPNGSGKTTLLKCLNGLLKIDYGKIELNGRPIDKYSPAELSKLIAYVPQFNSVTFPLTLFETVLLGRRQGYAWKHNSADIELTAKILEEMNLEELADRPVNELSGGEQQKGAIARSLVQETPLILMDEPTNNLDIKHQYEIMNNMVKYSRENGKGILLVLHDINIASAIADHLVIMKNGYLVKQGSPDEIITADLIQTVYGIGAEIISHRNRPHLLINP